jgi:hypothetical protein
MLYPQNGVLFPLYLAYALTVPDPGVIREWLHPKERIDYAYGATGMAHLVTREQWLRDHPDLSLDVLSALSPETEHREQFERNLLLIQEIKRICDEYGIELTVFLNPMYQSFFQSKRMDLYSEYLRRLAAITPYTDFSGITPWSTDARNFYDYLHFRPSIGREMIRAMTASSTNQSVGVFVTSEHSALRIQELRQQWESLERL